MELTAKKARELMPYQATLSEIESLIKEAALKGKNELTIPYGMTIGMAKNKELIMELIDSGYRLTDNKENILLRINW